MKKIIKGKIYDTGTAKLLAEYSCGSPSSFEFFREKLYQKKTGEFFIHGEGHAASKYAIYNGNSWGPGEKIMPIGAKGAQEWAEENLDAEDYASIFGVPKDDESTYLLSVRITAKARAVLEQKRIKTKKTFGQIISDMLEEKSE